MAKAAELSCFKTFFLTYSFFSKNKLIQALDVKLVNSFVKDTMKVYFC